MQNMFKYVEDFGTVGGEGGGYSGGDPSPLPRCAQSSSVRGDTTPSTQHDSPTSHQSGFIVKLKCKYKDKYKCKYKHKYKCKTQRNSHTSHQSSPEARPCGCFAQSQGSKYIFRCARREVNTIYGGLKLLTD